MSLFCIKEQMKMREISAGIVFIGRIVRFDYSVIVYYNT